MIYVIVLNWNGARDTIACLQSLSKLSGELPRVLVCDNASIDDSWAVLENYIGEQDILNIQLIQTGANLGFAGGNNIGMQIALSDPAMNYVWILNNDTKVATDSLTELVIYMNHNHQVGICGSTLLYMDSPDYIQAVGGKYNYWLGLSRHVLAHKRYSQKLCQSIDPLTLDYVVGASMFVRRSVLETTGLLSEDYFLYCEEIDWATRLKKNIFSNRLGYAPKSLVYHKEGASTGAHESDKKSYSYFADYFFITSRLKFTRKYGLVQSLMVQGSMIFVGLNRLRRGQYKSALVALWCFLGRIPSSLDPRRG